MNALRANLNDSITDDAAIDMLSQHLVTKPVFDALFPGHAFTSRNPVAQVMQSMLEILEGSNLEAETQELQGFYDSVRIRAAGIDNAAGKQKVITELYEKFFKTAFPRQADALGIVYTPVEVVDFILRGVNDLLHTEFGTSLAGKDVHILDPFTGTGTFITRLLADPNLIPQKDLARKYTSELHANEITLLAYYIAAANIEATYADRVTPDGHTLDGGAWEPFDGIVLADTFQMTEADDTLDGKVFRANSERADRQLALPITAIIGNPPYSVGQTSGNDNNANLKYPTLDGQIEKTYAARSTATNKNSLYDSYIRAIRWASNRIGDRGIIGFVTNGGFLDSNTADGLRKSLADEFSSIYIYNLRGNMRSPNWRAEGGQIFGAGSQATVTITFLVKHQAPVSSSSTSIVYRQTPDGLDRAEKLTEIETARIGDEHWSQIVPNPHGDWLNQRGDDFQGYQPLGGNRQKPTSSTVFTLMSAGLQTNRDTWVYNYSRGELAKNVAKLMNFYNTQVDDFAKHVVAHGITKPRDIVDQWVSSDATKISWARSLRQAVAKGIHLTFNDQRIVTGGYRPFCKQMVYFDRLVNHEPGQTPAMFPTVKHSNHGFVVVAPGSDKAFAAHAVGLLPDLSMWGSGPSQFFPRYTWEPIDEGKFDGGAGAEIVDGYRRIDNITDQALSTYQRWYGEEVTKDDIFKFVYGLLHSADYRAQFAPDLKRSLPRVPRLEAEDFGPFRDGGQQLLDLHIGYEDVDPYPLAIAGGDPSGPGSGDLYAWFAVEKLKWGGKGKDRSTIVYNPRVTISGIPEEAHGYMLGSRSGLEWIFDRYQIKTDKASGIVNDPNDWSREVDNPRYILDLIGKVTTVSVETVRIVESLPPLRIHPDQNTNGR